MRATALIFLLCLACSASAEAHTPLPLPLAYKEATSYLHKTACSGNVKIVIAAETEAISLDISENYGGKAAQALSWAEYVGPEGPNNPENGNPASFTDCVITLNSYYWSSPFIMKFRFKLLCVALIHELGNLEGLSETNENFLTHNVRDYWLEKIIPPHQCATYPEKHKRTIF
jgi:hypothetical protein